MDEYLVGELQCPVCLELLNWPIILPCSHVLCRDPCAERLFVHGFIRCPVSFSAYRVGSSCSLYETAEREIG